MPRLYVTSAALAKFKAEFEEWVPPTGIKKSYTSFLFWLLDAAGNTEYYRSLYLVSGG